MQERRDKIEVKVEEAVEQLEQLLNEGKGDLIINTIEDALKVSNDNPAELYRTLDETLKQEFKQGIHGLVLGSLVEQKVMIEGEGSSKVQEFLQNLVSKYSITIRKSYMNLYTPDDWRYATSSAKIDQRGARLTTDIVKWDGKIVSLSANIPNVVNLAQHLIKNLNTSFDNLQDPIETFGYVEPTQRQISSLRSELDSLENSLEGLKKIEDNEE